MDTKSGSDTYAARQAACRCLTPKRRAYVEAAMSHAADWSDGAFFGYMQERGIDVTELEPFATDHDCRKP